MRKIISIICVICSLVLLSVPCFADKIDASDRVCDTADILSDDIELLVNNLDTTNPAIIYIYTSGSDKPAKDLSKEIVSSNELGTYYALVVINPNIGDYNVSLGSGLSMHLNRDEVCALITSSFNPLFAEGKIDDAVSTFCTELCNKISTLEIDLEKDAENEKSSSSSSAFLSVLKVIVIIIAVIALLLVLGIYLLRQYNIKKARQKRKKAMLIPKDKIVRGPAKKYDFNGSQINENSLSRTNPRQNQDTNSTNV